MEEVSLKIKQGIKHLIDCNCVLPQFRNLKNPIFHKFITFSIIDENDNVIEKYTQCPNCDVVHRVFDICHSEIISGKDKLISINSIDDIKLSLPKNLSEILSSYNVSLPIWEEVQFLLENKIYEKQVIILSEEDQDKKYGKILKIVGENTFRIEGFSHQVEF